MDVRDITEKIKQRSSSEIAAIEKAFRFAEKYHEGELRYSGEPYLVHPFAVAQTLAGMHLDTNTIIAGLLHDVCESAPEEEKEAQNSANSARTAKNAILRICVKCSFLSHRTCALSLFVLPIASIICRH